MTMRVFSGLDAEIRAVSGDDEAKYSAMVEEMNDFMQGVIRFSELSLASQYAYEVFEGQQNQEAYEQSRGIMRDLNVSDDQELSLGLDQED